MLQSAHRKVQDNFQAELQGKLLADRQIPATLLKEISEVYARKQKLEEAIKRQEAVTDSLQQAAALREIEAHKGRLLLPC